MDITQPPEECGFYCKIHQCGAPQDPVHGGLGQGLQYDYIDPTMAPSHAAKVFFGHLLTPSEPCKAARDVP